MKWLIAGVAAGVLISPVAQAQMSSSPSAVAPSAPDCRRGSSWCSSPWTARSLTADARQVISEAAADYRRVGRGAGQRHRPHRYLRFSRAEPAPVRPASRSGRGRAGARGRPGDQHRHHRARPGGSPGADCGRGARAGESAGRNPGAPAASAPRRHPWSRPPPPPAPPPPEPDRFTFALGPVYGHNFGESDGKEGGDKTQNDLVGAELTFRALPSFLGGLSLKQMALWSFNGLDDGVNGRSVASLDFAPDFGMFRPTLAINGGGVYGPGFQDGFVAGPEIRFDITPVAGFNIGLKAAYDYQFRNAGWDEGIAWGGLDLGIRF